jgi:hypothetical protein
VDNLGFSLFLSRDGMSCYRNLLSLYSECAPSITFIPENTRNSRFLLGQSWNGVCCFPSELWVRWRCKFGFAELKWLVTFAAGGHEGLCSFVDYGTLKWGHLALIDLFSMDCDRDC